MRKHVCYIFFPPAEHKSSTTELRFVFHQVNPSLLSSIIKPRDGLRAVIRIFLSFDVYQCLHH